MAKRKKRGRTPQPPAPPAPPPQQIDPTSYNLQYTPTVESQINQPYQDVLSGGALAALPGVFQNIGGQQQYGDIFGGQSAMTLGQYGQLLEPNLPIQQRIAQSIQDIQAGKADFDPFLTQQFNDQERVLRDQLRRQLGPDYESSSPGIEALAKFQQNKTTTLGSAQFQRLNELVGMQQQGIGSLANQAGGFQNIYGQRAQDIYNQSMGLRSGQLGGAGQILAQTGATQDLYANVPKTMGQFGEAMTGQGGAAVQAQSPYQRDRFAQLQNLQTTPSEGQYMGQMMAQSGNRWVNVGGSMMGGGMGGGGG